MELGDAVEKHPPHEPDAPPLPRRFKITMQTLKEYGTTAGCKQCEHFKAFGETKSGLGHSEACRKRITEAMIATEHGAARVRDADERIDRAISERVRVAHESNVSGHVPATSGTAHGSGPGHGGADPKPDWLIRHETGLAALPTVAAEDRARNAERAALGEDLIKPIDASDTESDVADDEQMGIVSPHPQDAGISAWMLRKSCSDRQHDDNAGYIQAVTYDDECLNILLSMGADPHKFKREHRSARNRIVSEIYSPPRVTKTISEMIRSGLTAGFAFDLTRNDPHDNQPWDFNLPEKRQRAIDVFEEQQPGVLIGSPMCTAWCTWQRLVRARDPIKWKKARDAARVHLRFVCDL